ncbi:hypothetical protein J421_1563 [Gemmatirosa kalamazoonensis]|uniref:Uncharacterized protein n=1 Tax=Gemmatirosa kalamazoonensis TaxID=861299 RepID=W0RFI3_9BACT|nr:hypothetical protein [Gemmatirosa kalamazoonensis]AHG89100.1 hypothetical protein J421_1563 [Gemmatirosa kalamazoonensis]
MTKRAEFVEGRRTRAAAGQFFVNIEVRAQPNASEAKLLRALVDPEGRYSWVPAAALEDLGIMRRQPIWFTTPDGERVSRLAGYAFFTTEGAQTVDTVIFAEQGDPTILGGHALAAMNLVPDAQSKRLVAGQPLQLPTSAAP